MRYCWTCGKRTSMPPAIFRGAVNVPLSTITASALPKDRPLFLYCLRGARSKRAVRILRQKGFTQVKSIGGIAAYHGQLEAGK